MPCMRLIALAARSALTSNSRSLADAIFAHPASIFASMNQTCDLNSHISHQIRHLASSSSLFSSNLTKTLDDEISEEESGYAKPSEMARGPPSPWALRESPDDTLLTLQRKIGTEDISIDLQVNNQPSFTAEESDEGQELNLVTFNVTVTKGEDAMVFECESDGTFVDINHISHEPKDGHVTESAYTGPVFEELDETLQTDFIAYLADRGVTEDVGEYLRHLIYDKEQRSYLAWLKKVSYDPDWLSFMRFVYKRKCWVGSEAPESVQRAEGDDDEMEGDEERLAMDDLAMDFECEELQLADWPIRF